MARRSVGGPVDAALDDLYKRFGSRRRMCEVLGVTGYAVSQWSRGGIPVHFAVFISELFNNEIRALDLIFLMGREHRREDYAEQFKGIKKRMEHCSMDDIDVPDNVDDVLDDWMKGL